MDVDLIGRVRNTTLSAQHALLPLFEAVVNSIHAIADLPDPSVGRIDIVVERDTSNQHLQGVEIVYPIRSIVIQDNGIGFTAANYTSFSTADSTKKLKIGGKGVGRFLWLKAFDHADVESNFVESDGQWRHRSFSLRLSTSGIEDAAFKPSEEQHQLTTVRLVEMKVQYQKHAPRQLQIIANRTVEHCLQHFVLGLAPRIFLTDSETRESINLNDVFDTHVSATTEPTRFEISGKHFDLRHLRLALGYESNHRIYFCANKRAVVSEKLDGKVPNLFGPLHNADGKAFVYAGYISGDYLDERVNNERTAFTISDDPGLSGELAWSDLVSGAAKKTSEFLAPFTASVKQEKEDRIRTFVQTKAPHYRPLLKHKAASLDSIPPNLSDEKLDLELYRRNQDYDAELRDQGSQLLTKIEQGAAADIRKGYESFLQEWNEAGMAKLATHVAHRRATLKLLRASLQLTGEGKYELESTVHGLIFPLKKTSDDVPANKMNLWIIDEKLAFHFYLASDVPFKQLQKDIIVVDSDDRPDLVIFNQPSAFVNQDAPFGSVVLIEFKRPARDNYVDEENPISQVATYVNQIKSGKAIDRGGRPISVPPHVPFYAYIIADITDSLRFQAQLATLVPSPDGLGFFGFNPQIGVYFEIISFDKLVNDAERRNAAFFDQLGIL